MPLNAKKSALVPPDSNSPKLAKQTKGLIIRYLNAISILNISTIIKNSIFLKSRCANFMAINIKREYFL